MSSHVVEEDIPDCRTVYEKRCMREEEGKEVCADIPRQVCKLNQEERTKAMPMSKVRQNY